MNFNVPPVIQDTSRGAMKHKPIDGMVDTTFLMPSQRQMADGLITGTSRGASRSEARPIRAEGSYVGAPAMPVGHHVPAFHPATRPVMGKRMPVGQN